MPYISKSDVRKNIENFILEKNFLLYDIYAMPNLNLNYVHYTAISESLDKSYNHFR